MAKKKVETQLCTSVARGLPARAGARRRTLAFSLGSDLVEFRIDRLTRGRRRPGELEARALRLREEGDLHGEVEQRGRRLQGEREQRLDLISRLARWGPPTSTSSSARRRRTRSWLKSLPKGVRKDSRRGTTFKDTPALEALQAICAEGLDYGAVRRWSPRPQRGRQPDRPCRSAGRSPARVISFCMGGLGTVSRVVSMQAGSASGLRLHPERGGSPGTALHHHDEDAQEHGRLRR